MSDGPAHGGSSEENARDESHAPTAGDERDKRNDPEREDGKQPDVDGHQNHVDEIIALSLAKRLVSLDPTTVSRLTSGELTELRIVAADAFFSPDDGKKLANTPGIERGVLTYTNTETGAEHGKFTATYSSGGPREEYRDGDGKEDCLLECLDYFSVELPAPSPAPATKTLAAAPAPAPAAASGAVASEVGAAPPSHTAASAWDRTSKDDPPEDAPLFLVPIENTTAEQYKQMFFSTKAEQGGYFHKSSDSPAGVVYSSCNRSRKWFQKGAWHCPNMAEDRLTSADSAPFSALRSKSKIRSTRNSPRATPRA